MIEFKKLGEIIQKKVQSQKLDIPKHIIINTQTRLPGLEPDKEDEIKKKSVENISLAADLQIEFRIPILTVSFDSDICRDAELSEFIETLIEKANQNKVRVSVIGSWYDLRGDIVDDLKKLINETQDYDNLFLNLCINYDGQQEIVDACRVIIRKIIFNNLEMDSINKELIKQNLYSSYFLPPDLIIECSNRFRGTFLWDCINSIVYCTNKTFDMFSKLEFTKALESYKRDLD
ncbi:undecaprenyl diphosphate synthase family protein [Candidatus Woesearchaeota archaeon]|nr:undecaprenyl diphosphate synthase family protein [Candidatus Woesearchaeota archaeon]